MNKPTQSKLRVRLALIGLFLLTASCSLDINKNTIILKNMSQEMFEAQIKDKKWGNPDSSICVTFKSDHGNAGKLYLKKGTGPETAVGHWSYAEKTFRLFNTAGIFVKYESQNTSLILVVEYGDKDRTVKLQHSACMKN